MGKLVQESVRRLQAQGGRMTSQRRLILDTLEALSDHPTAEDLFELVRQQDPSLHLSTVYRTLRWLEQEELVSPRVFKEDRRQERFDAAYPSEHHHFMCTACRSVIEFDTQLIDPIKTRFEQDTGAQIAVGSIVLYGICQNCRLEQLVCNRGGGDL